MTPTKFLFSVCSRAKNQTQSVLFRKCPDIYNRGQSYIEYLSVMQYDNIVICNLSSSVITVTIQHCTYQYRIHFQSYRIVMKMYLVYKIMTIITLFVWNFGSVELLDFELRIDLMPACATNQNNSARFGALRVIRLPRNRVRLNGTLIVDRTIRGPLKVKCLCSN